MSLKNIALIFGAVFLGILAGSFIEPQGALFEGVDLVGKLFLNALKLVIVPLVVTSIMTGIAKMGEEEKVALLGAKTFSFYFLACFLAVLCGFGAVMLLQPGLKQASLAHAALKTIEPISLWQSLSDIILRLFPPNLFQALAEGQMLGLIVFSLLFGFFTSKIEPQLSGTLQSFFKGVFQVMMKITHFIIGFLPIGVFALIAKVVATTGFDAVKSASWFFITALVAFFLYGGVTLSLMLRYIGKISPWRHIQAMGPALLTAFTTSSSAATFPITLECLEKRAAVSNRIAGFTLPVGTSFHMAGTACFATVAVIFIAQAYGIALSFAEYILILLLSVLMSIGIAGIPSGCLVAVIVILSLLKLPMEGLALLFVVERVLDMLRTVINVYSNTVCTVLVAQSEKAALPKAG